MDERLRKERTEEIIGIAREQLNDDRVQEKLGKRGWILRAVAGMMRVPDIDESYLVSFPEYENRDVFPVVSLSKDERFVSTMTARMPIQQLAIRTRASKLWGEQGFDYTEEDLQSLLRMPTATVVPLNYSAKEHGFHMRAMSVHLYSGDEQLPYMVRFGRPHIVVHSRPGSKVKDEASTLIHELSHAVDTIVEPLVFQEYDDEYKAARMVRLRTELAAYATQALVRRVFRTKGEAIQALFDPALCDVVESHRRAVNGLYTSEQAFDPNWTIEQRLARAGLTGIYWDAK